MNEYCLISQYPTTLSFASGDLKKKSLFRRLP